MAISIMMIIERPGEVNRIKNQNKWVLVYGRRKTGKSFLLENFIDYDEYFFVKRDKGIIARDREEIGYDSLIQILNRGLRDGKKIILDEFHRLGEDFFDFLHSKREGGKLILVSSTLFLSKKLISEKSPLLGLFAEVPIKLIRLKDSLKELNKLDTDKKSLMELAIQAREPISIGYITPGQENKKKREKPREILSRIIKSSAKTIPALIGEIFVEEERKISAIYEGILRAIANGKVVSGEISSYLFSRKAIKKDDPSLIQQHLKNLIDFGIIKKTPIFNKNRFVYKHVSPLAKIFYYADEKYNISEREVGKEEIQEIVEKVMPRIVEENVRETIAKKNGLRETIIDKGDYEIDGYLLKFKKPHIALEVKWGNLNKNDLKGVEEKLEKIEAKRKILFVPDKRKVSLNASWLEVMDPKDLIE